VCVSAALGREFLRLYPGAAKRTVVIPNASALPPLEPDEPQVDELGLTPGGYVLAVGRLEATKRFDDLIKAFELAGRGDLKLVILGSGIGNEDYAAGLRRSASERILFGGFQRGARLRRLYDEAALFVHPSGMEGFGLVISEALEAGLPVILSDIPPHREFGLPDACYYPGGDVAALADKLRTASYDGFRAVEASERQRSDSWERVAREHVALYRQVEGRSG
jgi:glycosyltransferase involved in cell wall biosynthesis